MRGLVARLKSMGRTAWSRWWVLLGGLFLVPAVWTADRAYLWVAWNWWNVPFQAACRHYENRFQDNVDDLEFIHGTLSAEFWDDMRFLLPRIYPRLHYSWRKDGVLMVPRGLMLPVEDEFWSRIGQEPEELSHWIAADAATRIYQRRKEEGIDMAPYGRYIERPNAYWNNFDGPSPDVCGMMEKLVFNGGELSR